jgi:hypothetical protein
MRQPGPLARPRQAQTTPERRANRTNASASSIMTAMTISDEPCGQCIPLRRVDRPVSSCHGCGVPLEAASVAWPAPDTCLITFQSAEGYEHAPDCLVAHSSGPHWTAPSIAVEWQEPACCITGCGNPRTAGAMSCETHRCQATATSKNERCGNTAKNGPWCVHHRYPSGFPRGFAATPEMRAWACENAPDIDPDAETPRFAAYWSVKRIPAPRERDWPELWRSWITVARDEALRLAKVPRNSGISPSMIQDARRIAPG